MPSLALRFVLRAMVCLCLGLGISKQSLSSQRIPSAGEISTPDGRLYFEAHGSGPVLVLLAGGPGGPRTSLMPDFDRLADHHTVIYMDNIGRGRSDSLSNGKHHSPWRDAEDVERLRVALQLEQISLLGHSYGGYAALAYAAKHSEHLQRLVISSGGSSFEAWQRNIDSANLTVRNQFPEVWDRLVEMRARGIKSCSKEYQALYGQAMGDLYWYDLANEKSRKPFVSGDPRDQMHIDVYCDMLGDDPEWQVGGQMAVFDARPGLSSVHVPTFVSVGRFDRICPPLTAVEIVKAFPAGVAHLHVYERSGHRPWVEQSDAFFKDVEDFLADK